MPAANAEIGVPALGGYGCVDSTAYPAFPGEVCLGLLAVLGVDWLLCS